MKLKNKIDSLPSGGRAKSQEYQKLIEILLLKEDGVYPIDLEGKKANTAYQQIYKLIKDNKNLRISKIKGELYLTKTSELKKGKASFG